MPDYEIEYETEQVSPLQSEYETILPMVVILKAVAAYASTVKKSGMTKRTKELNARIIACKGNLKAFLSGASKGLGMEGVFQALKNDLNILCKELIPEWDIDFDPNQKGGE